MPSVDNKPRGGQLIPAHARVAVLMFSDCIYARQISHRDCIDRSE